MPRPVGARELSIVVPEHCGRCSGFGDWTANRCRRRSANRVATEALAFLVDDVVLEPAVVKGYVGGVGQAVGRGCLILATRLCRLV